MKFWRNKQHFNKQQISYIRIAEAIVRLDAKAEAGAIPIRDAIGAVFTLPTQMADAFLWLKRIGHKNIHCLNDIILYSTLVQNPLTMEHPGLQRGLLQNIPVQPKHGIRISH